MSRPNARYRSRVRREQPKTAVGHRHLDEKGVWQKCYHHCRHRWYVWGPILFAFQVFLFPLEHAAAEKVWSLPVLEQVADKIGYNTEEHNESE
jgi:hypothetical protein